MITKVELKNWKTHLHSKLEFWEGVNCLLGSMGSGKSSVLEAICFCLYGTTPSIQSRKLKIQDLIMKFPTRKHEAEIKVSLEIDGKKYDVVRKISTTKGTYHSEIREDGKLLAAPQTHEVTRVVEKVTGVDYDTFVQIVYGEQNRIDSFLSLRPAERKARMDEILKIHKIEEARANLVTLINNIKRDVQSKENMLAQWRKDMESISVEELEKELERKRKELEEKRREADKLEKELEKRREALLELKERKMRAEKLSNTISKLEGEINALLNEIRKAGMSAEELEKKELKEVEKRREELENKLKEVNSAEKELEALKSRKRALEEQIRKEEDDLRKLEEKLKMRKDLKELEKRREALEKEDRVLMEELSMLKTTIDKERESIEALSKAEASCPVCESKLTGEKKKELIAIKEGRIEEYRKRVGEINLRRKELMQELEKVKRERDEALKLKSLAEMAEKRRKMVEESRQNLSSIQKKIEEMERKLREADREELEKELKEAEKLLDLVEKARKARALEADVERLRREVAMLKVDESEMNELEKIVMELSQKMGAVKGELTRLREVIEEKERYLNEVKSRLESIAKMEAELSELKEKVSMLIKLQDVLIKAQVEIREEFVAALNFQMSRIWEVLYPYEDYQDVKLFVEDGYVLRLLSSEGVWVDADTFVSGGERMTAALTLRLALANLLAPSFKVMILDEPTHNLDSKAVEELGRTLRERAVEVLKQVILITHDETLAESAAEHLYRFERGEGKKDVTKATRVY